MEKKKHGKLLSETSIDALLFPSRLTPPGPYDPEQSPQHDIRDCLFVEMKMEEPMDWIPGAANTRWSRRMGNFLIQIVRANAVLMRNGTVL